MDVVSNEPKIKRVWPMLPLRPSKGYFQKQDFAVLVNKSKFLAIKVCDRVSMY